MIRTDNDERAAIVRLAKEIKRGGQSFVAPEFERTELVDDDQVGFPNRGQRLVCPAENAVVNCPFSQSRSEIDPGIVASGEFLRAGNDVDKAEAGFNAVFVKSSGLKDPCAAEPVFPPAFDRAAAEGRFTSAASA